MPDITKEKPLRISIIPKVAINGGIFIFETKVPEHRPHSAPDPIAAIIPSGKGMPKLVRTTPAITAVKVIKVPTERSIPPVIMTSVAAIALPPSPNPS